MIRLVNVLEALRKGDTAFLDYDRRTDSDIRTTLGLIIKEPDGVEIFKKNMPKLIKQIRGQMLFDYIYDIVELKEYSYYLIAKGQVRLEELNSEQVSNMMRNTTWGELFILNNLKKILEKDSYKKIRAIVDNVINNDDSCKRFLNRFIYDVDSDKRILFVTSLINTNKDILARISFDIDKIILEKPNDNIQMVLPGVIEEKKPKILPHDNLITLLNSFINYKMPDDQIAHLCDKIMESYDKNDVASVLLKTNNATLYKYMVDNFEQLFESSTAAKMDMLTKLRGMLNPEVTNKYHVLLALFNMIDCTGFDCHQIFSNVINYNLYDYFKDTIKRYYDQSVSKELKYLDHGITSYVFRVGDYVIKVGNNRYCPVCPEHYRILKNVERKMVVNEKNQPIFYIEVQRYLEQKNQEITDDMIYELFVDLKDSGLELTDPCSLRYQHKNFALLENYEDANVDESKLSPAFKKNPLVVIDVDLIYKRNDRNKKYFQERYAPGDYTMDHAIRDYEETKAFTKKLK